MRAYYPTVLLPMVASITLSCGGGGGGSDNNAGYTNNDPVVTETPVPRGMLIRAETDSDIINSVRQGLTTITEANAAERALSQPSIEVAASDSLATSSGNYTTTYTLEKNVDEHDYVKYDGDHMFIAPSKSMDCCFIMEDAIVEEEDRVASSGLSLLPPTQTGERTIRILKTEPVSASIAQVSAIELDTQHTVEGLYVSGSQLVAISSSGWWGSYGSEFLRVSRWREQTTVLDIYDISDIGNPSSQFNIEVEGGFVSSRRKDNIIYFMTRHSPSIKGFEYSPTAEQQTENEQLLSSLTVAEILPKISVGGELIEAIGVQDCFLFDQDNEQAPTEIGYPTLTIMFAIDLESSSLSSVRCYLESTNGIYVSENAIYLAQVDTSSTKSKTILHGYELSSDLSYLGSGVVEGALYLDGNRDFRINEYRGYLRVVTTDRDFTSDDRFDHRLSTLKLNEQELRMDLISTLPNENRPQEIGKPNEDLYGVRFFGNTLYLVTFERIDPLYVVDLSVPSDPVIAGELTVTGFSDFLHPVSEKLLLGLGQDESGLVKLELFDVGQMNMPSSLGAMVLGSDENARWSYSEARYNRHAFTYQQINDDLDRFLVPVSMGLYSDESGYQNKDRLYMFELRNKSMSNLASIFEVGRITMQSSWDKRNRSFIHDDAVYYINGTKVWSALWGSASEQSGPF
ncbi:MAG: hypothetical protein CBC09_01480 [Cellvibrionales bacterium TMED49]|nr:hypothetical protein [Porticoccaceae bacterium]OUU39791.1 MAG: hypothetical protein CBC09_01480 [Cellvibrionales bacterium TMED49]